MYSGVHVHVGVNSTVVGQMGDINKELKGMCRRPTNTDHIFR